MEDDIQSILNSSDEFNPSEGRLPDEEILNIFAEAGELFSSPFHS